MPAMIDINADAGESFGRWSLGDDEEFLKHVSSVNIACGFHAGDPVTMEKTALIAKKQGVALGAHPGLPDILGFGRRIMSVTAEEIAAYTLYQIGALAGIAASHGMHVEHVKPHGAFYKMCSLDLALSESVARAVKAYDSSLILVLLAGAGADAAEAVGARVAREAFIDLDYSPEGELIIERVARLRDPSLVAHRALSIVRDGCLAATDGSNIPVRVDTLCLHGDRANSVEVAKVVKETLAASGIKMRRLNEGLAGGS